MTKSSIISLDSGKIPPQAVELEDSVIGALISFSNAADICFEIIKTPDAFYLDKHKKIFKAIKNLSDNSSPIDLLTVSEQLKKQGDIDVVGGDYYLINLSQKVTSSAHVEYHSRVVLQKFMLRELIKMGNRIIERAYDSKTDVFDLIDSVGTMLDEVDGIAEKGTISLTWEDAVLEVPKRVEFLTNNNGDITGVDTGLTNFNKHFGGWQPNDLIIIGADSGMGKTALAMLFMLSSAKQGKAVGMASMEMSVVQLAIRGVAVESEYHMRQLTQTGFEKQQYFQNLNAIVHEMKSLPIYIDDRPSLTVQEMKRKARQMKRKHDIKFFVVDFIQMFKGDDDPVKLTGEAARELKNLAKELQIPVIALSQLNREVKKAKYNIPSKHHLKNSSGVEEAADVILLLYRPDYYGFTHSEHPMLFDDLLGLKGHENAVGIVAKNRNGGLGNIPMCYISNKTKYVNPEEYDSVVVDDEKTVFDA